MLKLVLKVPEKMDAEKLMQTAVAWAQFKSNRKYSLGLESKDVVKADEYDELHLPSLTPDKVFNSVTSLEDHTAGMEEYTVDGYMLDIYITESLADLQKIFPFEMYFENRGEFAPTDWEDDRGEIYDDAIWTLHYAEPKTA